MNEGSTKPRSTRLSKFRSHLDFNRLSAATTPRTEHPVRPRNGSCSGEVRIALQHAQCPRFAERRLAPEVTLANVVQKALHVEVHL